MSHDGGVLDAADDAGAQRGNRLTATRIDIETPVASGTVVGARDSEARAPLTFRVESLHIGRNGERPLGRDRVHAPTRLPLHFQPTTARQDRQAPHPRHGD
ncbi:Hypothetical protein AA314_04590 [Archangium gephyra]|uniref:Uncharacterized protein n=1 Tax=Archangium gephyra TaxID=48 RepID=A0AAC8Q8U4_9BACT|nr:Hypothetical protein AA314_04590 [Archangium gephyra]